ncbi:hypothetical protein Acr_28g0012880 [Actinidia rufa]|uniref:Uncharacterized protein n=1 Tax=Actinidia rufa TaxID=165716 RepID=A0A7J0HBW7_9ERIC|nr:hypothetical protein Acr_28g0012880 [Actinidia rufa]
MVNHSEMAMKGDRPRLAIIPKGTSKLAGKSPGSDSVCRIPARWSWVHQKVADPAITAGFRRVTSTMKPTDFYPAEGDVGEDHVRRLRPEVGRGGGDWWCGGGSGVNDSPDSADFSAYDDSISGLKMEREEESGTHYSEDRIRRV